MELSQFSQLVFVVFDLPVEVETRSLLLEDAFLLLSWVRERVLLGKKR
jgi:hypothetical protein